jgi:hypothetical protein
VSDEKGRLHAIREVLTPTSARIIGLGGRDRSGLPVAGLLATSDGESWASHFCGRDLDDPRQLRDGIEIEFPPVADEGRSVLLVRTGATGLRQAGRGARAARAASCRTSTNGSTGTPRRASASSAPASGRAWRTSAWGVGGAPSCWETTGYYGVIARGGDPQTEVFARLLNELGAVARFALERL